MSELAATAEYLIRQAFGTKMAFLDMPIFNACGAPSTVSTTWGGLQMRSVLLHKSGPQLWLRMLCT